jgi:hypothetical protein
MDAVSQEAVKPVKVGKELNINGIIELTISIGEFYS